MWTRTTMYGTWLFALVVLGIAATQSSVRTWLGDVWVTACVALAMISTVMFEIGKKRQKRWNAGHYD